MTLMRVCAAVMLLLLVCTSVVQAQEQTNKIGIVLEITAEGNARISLGKEEGVSEGNIFAVYTVTKVVKLPLAGEVSLKQEKEAGKLRVVSVSAHEAIAAVLVKSEGTELEKGMTVIQVIEEINENEAPVIVAIHPEVTSIDGGKGIPLKVNVIDREGDTFELSWTTDKGSLALARTTRMNNKWIAPLEAGEAVLTVTAVDSWGNSSSKTVNLVSNGTTGGSRNEFTIFRQLGNEASPSGNLLANAMKIDNNGDLYILDTDKGGVFKHLLDIPSNPLKLHAYISEEREYSLKSPPCFDVTGNRVFIIDGYGLFIRKFDKNGTYLGSMGSGSGSAIGMLSQPRDMAVAEDGTIYIADSGNTCIEVFNEDGTSRFRAGKVGEGDGEIQMPVSVELDNDGLVYVLDGRRNQVLVYSSRMEYIRSITVDLNEDLELVDMVLDKNAKRLYILDAESEQVLAFGLQGEFNGVIGEEKDTWQHTDSPASIAVNPLGQILVGSSRQTQVTRYNSDGTFSAKQDIAFYQYAEDVCATGNKIFLLESKYYQIRVFDYTGWCTAVIGGNSKKGGTFGKISRLAANDAFVYALDPYYHNVHKLTHAGIEEAVIGDKGEEPGKFIEPADIALDNQGTLFVLDTELKRVSMFDVQGQYTGAFANDTNASIQMNSPTLITVSPDGNSIYLYDARQYTVIKYDRQGVAQSFYGQKGSKEVGQFYYVDSIGLDETGYLVVSEPRYDRIQKIDFTGPSGRPYFQYTKADALYKGAEKYTVDPYGQLIMYDNEGKIILLR